MHPALSLLEEQANAGIWHLTRDRLKLWWSDGMYRIYGLSRESYNPTLESLLNFFTPESQLTFLEHLSTSLETGEEFGAKLRIRHADGRHRDLQIVGRPVRENGVVQVITGAVLDLNALHADIDLSQSTEGHFESLIASTPFGLALTSADEKILLANSAFCDMVGYTEVELLGTSLTDLLDDDDRERVTEHMKQLWSSKSTKARLERRYRHRDGRLICVQVAFNLLRDESGRPLHAIRQFEEITERKRQEEELFASKELAQVTLASITDGVIRTDLDGMVTFCNEGAAKLIGKSPHVITGVPFQDSVELTDAQGQPFAVHPLTYTLQTGLASQGLISTHIRDAAGSRKPIHHSVSPLRNRAGDTIGAVFVFQDATESFSFTKRLSFEATHDYLTGLPNRAAAEQALAALLSGHALPGRAHFLCFLDLDHFKIVNDTSGHIAGDLLVKQISDRIGTTLRSDDLLARFGGDEFVVILPNTTARGAEAVAQKILDAVSNYRFTFGERTYQVSVSIGMAEVTGSIADLSRLLAQADAACYSAKNQGRGKFRFFSQAASEISTAYDDLGWSQRIRMALGQNLLQLYFQKIVDGRGSLLGVECLLRMKDEAGATVSPHAFLPAAERMGLMPQIDQWVVRRGVELLAEARDCGVVAGQIGSYLSVNVSARTLGVSEFAQWLPEFLSEHADLCPHLRIEITETEKSSWTAKEVNLIAAIRLQGVRVLLDDFGMGYNSFDVLKTVCFDGIKLDRQVVKDIETDPVDQALAEASVAIARNLGMQLVAEGVETEASLAALKRLGVTCFQGHLFHRAQPIAASTATGIPKYASVPDPRKLDASGVNRLGLPVGIIIN